MQVVQRDNMKNKIFTITGLLILIFSINTSAQSFISVKNGAFVKNGKPYHYIGTNFWYGMNLGAYNKPRLIRELDRLQKIGVKNLRLMAASEGSADAPWRMQPSVQTAPGVYSEELLKGLDFLLAEMKKRDMVAIMCLNNFWQWSGGFVQYVSWANNNEAIPYPPPAEGGDWKKYQEYSAQFYSSNKAQQWFRKYIHHIVNRINTITKLPYKKDTAIMAWQLANEPVGANNVEAYRNWIDETAKYIKGLDETHLVSIGSEGNTPSPKNGTNFEIDHQSVHIDYCTFHLWAQNWGWYDPSKPETYTLTQAKAKEYIATHVAAAKKLNKPLVLEEFGISRDGNSYSAESAVTKRDSYYNYIFDLMYRYAETNPNVAGVNFWAWGGEARPRITEGGMWQKGDEFTGDPPHETQGWYSVFDIDSTTQKIIIDYTSKFDMLKH